MRNHACWSAFGRSCFGKGSIDVAEVVTVAFDRIPPERAKFRGGIVDRALPRIAIGRRPAELRQPVIVEDCGQIVELKARCRKTRLPNLPLLNFPVAKHDPRAK